MSVQPVDSVGINADATISRTIEALLGYHRLKGAARAALLDALDMSADTLSRRLDGSKVWTASEVATLAAFFDVPVADLFTGRVDLAESQVRPDVRISRETLAADEARFSGSDIDQFLTAQIPRQATPAA